MVALNLPTIFSVLISPEASVLYALVIRFQKLTLAPRV